MRVNRNCGKFLSLYPVFLRCMVITGLYFSFIANPHAQTERLEQEVAGRGADNMAAILNALQEATFQICGVRIQTTLDVESIQSEIGDSLEISDRINRSIRASTVEPNCEFEGYDVLEITGDGKLARASLRVYYTVYRVPGPAMKRRRIAVLGFPMEDVTVYGFGHGRESIRNVRNLEIEFTKKVEELLTQGRRFGVLDRSRPDMYEAEKLLLQSSDVDTGERARLGKVLGADYLLYGVIDRVGVEDRSRMIEITGEWIDRFVGFAEVRFTVLAAATRQIKWTSSISRNQEFDVNLKPEAIAASILHNVAQRMVDELTENIYPPKVTAVVGPDQFVLNRGGNTVHVGGFYEVFATGELLIDPDTGEPLDRIETSVGIAQIVDVKPKYSIAKLVSGNAELSRGMVLRRPVPDTGKGKTIRYQSPDFKDEDGDGLPDYLNRN